MRTGASDHPADLPHELLRGTNDVVLFHFSARHSSWRDRSPFACSGQQARAKVIGPEIATLPQLTSPLAGGFQSLAGPEELYHAIRAALSRGGFAEVNAVRDLPGTPRAAIPAICL